MSREKKEKWNFELNKFSINDGHFVFQNNNKPKKDSGFDYANMDVSEISSDTVDMYSKIASDYEKAKPHLYDTQKFAEFNNL